MEKETRVRKLYVDYIKAVGIILVIIGHINFANSNFGIKEWVYSFHMPLFFFATGLTLKEVSINLEYLKKKFTALIIPYIIWGLIYSELSFKNIAYIGYGSYTTLSRAGSLTSLWFLPAMFFSVIIVQIVFRVFKKDYQRVISMSILLIIGLFLPRLEIGYPLCIDIAILASVFIILGYYYEKNLANMQRLIMWILAVIGLFGTLLCLFNPVQQTTNVLMARRYLGNPLLFFVVAISGCAMVYGLSKIIDNGKEKKLLSYIGKNTMAIFAVHKPIIKLCEKLFDYFNWYWFLELGITVIITLFISGLLVVGINNYVPVLNGKK